MIDVHIIHNPNTPNEWFNAAVASVPTDICNLHIINMDNKSIAENRIRGFTCGNSEYISFVDDDDYVLPETFNKCLEVLEADKELAAVGTIESIIKDGELLSPIERDIKLVQNFINDVDKSWNQWKALHHVVVLRRSLVEEYFTSLSGNYPERAFYKVLYEAGLKAKLLMFSGYVWRQHNNNYHTRNTRNA